MNSQKHVDQEMLAAARDQRYGYDETDDSKRQVEPLFTKEEIYQAYDQTPNRGETTAINQESQKDYDAMHTDEDEEGSSSGDLSTDDEAGYELNKRTIVELLICILAFIGRGLCLNSIGPTLIDLRQIARMTITQSAGIFVSQSAGFLVGSVLAKIILQRVNNALVMSICLTIQALCTAFIPTFHSIVMMCTMYIGQGFAIGVVGIGVCAACIRLGGASRNGMFLQAVYLGTSMGSVLGPFIARPFLSVLAQETDNHETGAINSLEDNGLTDGMELPLMANSSLEHTISNDSVLPDPLDRYTETKVQYYYIIIALILCIPAVCFLVIFITRNKGLNPRKAEESEQYSLALRNCTIPLVLGIILVFVQCLLYFGIQDTYSNLLTTFAVLGPLHMTKSDGVYLTSLFWASMCFGRLNGIWVAKLVSPFKILLVDFLVASLAAVSLVIWGGNSRVILWGFTALLGLSFASVNGATVSWAATHLPKNNYILSIIMVGRCSGLLLLPTAVTALFKLNGAMTLMYALFVSVIVMLITILLAQGISYNFGHDGRIYGKHIPHKR